MPTPSLLYWPDPPELRALDTIVIAGTALPLAEMPSVTLDRDVDQYIASTKAKEMGVGDGK
jgi:hypothetical protein